LPCLAAAVPSFCPASLNIGCNKISSTAALQALPALRMLALHSNAIARPSAVLLLSSLASLQHLTLARNPVCQHSSWREATIAVLPGLQVGSSRWSQPNPAYLHQLMHTSTAQQAPV
jgi:hypothetical protein